VILFCIFRIQTEYDKDIAAAVNAEIEEYITEREAGETLADEEATAKDAVYDRESDKEPIVRIRLTTSDYDSEYHENVVLTCSQTFQLQTGEKAQIFTGGQTVTVNCNHPFFQEGSIRVSTDSGILQIDSISHRNQINTYPGILDLYLTEKGILIVNELGMEEYVKRVVPSEMPASYGIEAAKLQSVCARTYAYQKLMAGQVDIYGAIANDSTDYQVYNASLPKDISSQAADETKGTVLVYDGSPMVPYYFSTSCGFNTDNSVWSGTVLPYLRAQNLSYGENLNLQSEEVFRGFILNWDYPAYEDDCAWYRWNYTISLESLKTILPERIASCISEVPEKFRAVDPNGEVIAVDPAAVRNLERIQVTQRLKGGMVGEAALVCNQATIYVSGEMVLRRLLGCPERIYSNQSSEGMGESEGDYLPSAFFCLEDYTDENGNRGYSICGGGNGHGIGLSQNAAHAMLQSGLTWGEVLQFFYLGTSLVEIY